MSDQSGTETADGYRADEEPPTKGDPVRGRKVAVISIGLVVGMLAIINLLNVTVGEITLTSAIRDGLTLALCAGIFIGLGWARLLLAVLCMLGAIMAVVSMFAGHGALISILLLVIGGIFSFTGAIFMSSDDLKAFQFRQRKNRAA